MVGFDDAVIFLREGHALKERKEKVGVSYFFDLNSCRREGVSEDVFLKLRALDVVKPVIFFASWGKDWIYREPDEEGKVYGND